MRWCGSLAELRLQAFPPGTPTPAAWPGLRPASAAAPVKPSCRAPLGCCPRRSHPLMCRLRACSRRSLAHPVLLRVIPHFFTFNLLPDYYWMVQGSIWWLMEQALLSNMADCKQLCPDLVFLVANSILNRNVRHNCFFPAVFDRVLCYINHQQLPSTHLMVRRSDGMTLRQLGMGHVYWDMYIAVELHHSAVQ